MNPNEKSSGGGSLRISRDVISAIADAAAKEVPGVYALAHPPMDLRDIVGRGKADIDLTDGMAEIRMRLVLNSGARIRETAVAVQQAVKEAVQNMTGITVSRVNVVIAGIHYDGAAGED
jgi:uncharacterized alkaline shock family protein YloU